MRIEDSFGWCSILDRSNPGDDPTEHPEHDDDRKGEEEDA
jgi:hypothetical protein